MELSGKALLERVRNTRFFNSLTLSQAEELLAVCQRLALNPGDILFKENDIGSDMYLLLSGSMNVAASTLHGSARLAIIRPLGLIGEMGMLMKLPRSATVAAEEYSQLLKISDTALAGLFNKDPLLELQIYRNLCSILCDRLLKNNIRLEEYI